MTDEEKLQFDTLTAEVERLNEQSSQATANINALTEKYKELEADNEKKKEEIVTLKAANMALALTGRNEQKSADDILAEMFCKKG